MGGSVQSGGRGRRGRKTIAEINVVPYIDVMLVLLIIFMVTAPFVNPAVVDLPSVGRTSSKPQTPPLTIVIRTDGGLRLQGTQPAIDAVVDRAGMLAEVQRRQAVNPDMPVVIAADKTVQYDIVMQVMDALQQNNVKRVGLSVRPVATK
ncbi:protein TolR [soil metagenome]